MLPSGLRLRSTDQDVDAVAVRQREVASGNQSLAGCATAESQVPPDATQLLAALAAKVLVVLPV